MESLGLTLIRGGIVTPVDLAHAARIRDGRPLAERLVRLGLASAAGIAEAVNTASAGGSLRPAPLRPWKNGRPVSTH